VFVALVLLFQQESLSVLMIATMRKTKWLVVNQTKTRQSSSNVVYSVRASKAEQGKTKKHTTTNNKIPERSV